MGDEKETICCDGLSELSDRGTWDLLPSDAGSIMQAALRAEALTGAERTRICHLHM